MNILQRCLLGVGFFQLLSGCESRRSRQAAAEQPEMTQTLAPADAVGTPAGPVRDTTNLTRPHDRAPGPRDSLIAIGTRHYRLSVRVETDSTKPLYFGPASGVGAAFAAPGDSARRAGQVRGYSETYTFTLRDSLARKVIFRRQLHKPDFYKAASRDVLTVMNMAPPGYLGYSAPLDALVFVCYLGIPYSDVGSQATLLLDRRGRVQRLSPGGPAFSDAPDCDPRISPSGRAVLTCSEILRVGQPPLSLSKPHAQLRAARFLGDTTLLVLYEHGDYVARPAGPDSEADYGSNVTAPMTDVEFVSTPAQRRRPTAFIMGTSGHVLRRLRLVPDMELASFLARAWVRGAGAYLLVEADNKVVVVPKAHPENLFEIPLKKLPRFRLPLRPHEQGYSVVSGFVHLRFYVDTLNPRSLRVAPLPPPKG